jgi:hypothetical protein
MLNTRDGRIREIRPGDGWGALFARRAEDGEGVEAWTEEITYWALYGERAHRLWIGLVSRPIEDQPCAEAPDFVCYLEPSDSREPEDHMEKAEKELRYLETPFPEEKLRRAGYVWEEYTLGRWVSPHDFQLLTTRRAFEEMEAGAPQFGR